MKIKLNRNLPVGESMGMTKDSVFKVISHKTTALGEKIYYVQRGRMKVAVYHYECEVIEK